MASAVRPCPDNSEHDQAGDHRECNRPGADADRANGLAPLLVLRDLAVAGFFVLIAHRPAPSAAWRGSPDPQPNARTINPARLFRYYCASLPPNSRQSVYSRPTALAIRRGR